MNRHRPVMIALALAAGLTAAAAAQASPRADVQWSVTIGSPAVVLPRVIVPLPPLPHVHVVPAVRSPRVAYRERTRHDIDGDGIPNRYDRVYNPRWDVDGDGIPNRYDRHPRSPSRGDRYDRHDRHDRHDRDHDGIPNRRDPYPNQPRGGRGR